MDKSLVSIIVPVYNTAEYVEECIQSVISQSYKNIELILVNDGSTDSSGEICKKYMNFPNVHYFEQDNSGPIIARKKGVEEASGEWIMFVDSDDYLLNDAVKKMIDLSKGVDIVVGSSQFNLINEPDYISKNLYVLRMYERSIKCEVWAKLFHKSLFNQRTFNFSRFYEYAEDMLMNLQIAIDNSKDVRICHYPIYFHRINLSSTCYRFNYTLDYFSELCLRADRIVKEEMSYNDLRVGAALMRKYYFRYVFCKMNYRIDKKHPFVEETKKYLKDAGLYKWTDFLLFQFPSIFAYRVVMRLEHPSMIMRDLKRIAKIFACFLLVWGNLSIFAPDLAI